MNDALEQLAADIELDQRAPLRLAFGLACASRVRHLLESAEVVACVDALAGHLRGDIDDAAFQAWAGRALQLAQQHPGSKSIDGCGHAAVSASHAVAQALQGRALQAASYAAYAAVYADGGSTAVAFRPSFEPEFAWQIEALRALAHAGRHAGQHA
jgi:hypothetical protein